MIKEAREWGLHGLEHIQRMGADPDGQSRRDLRRGAALGLRRHRARDPGRLAWPRPASPRSGTPEQIAEWVPECFGTDDEIKLGAYAVTEPQAGSDVKRLRTTAKLDGDEWVLNGTKVFITNGGIADVHVVVATVDPDLGHRGQASFVVAQGHAGPVAGQEGVEARHPRLADRRGDPRGLPRSRWSTCSAGWTSSEEARARALGPATGRSSNALATFEMTRPLVGASALGIAQAAYEWTLEYLGDQTVDGGSRCSRSSGSSRCSPTSRPRSRPPACSSSAPPWMGRNGIPMTGGQGSMSKLKAGDVAMWATTTLMDLVGPYAQTTDCPLEKWFRDAKIYQLFEGTAQVQRLVISRMQARTYQERFAEAAEIARQAINGVGRQRREGRTGARRRRRLASCNRRFSSSPAAGVQPSSCR